LGAAHRSPAAPHPRAARKADPAHCFVVEHVSQTGS
jgi:hypothetical protein